MVNYSIDNSALKDVFSPIGYIVILYNLDRNSDGHISTRIEDCIFKTEQSAIDHCISLSDYYECTIKALIASQ